MKFRFLLIGLAAALMLSPPPALAARGSDGELKIIYWQAVSILKPLSLRRYQGPGGRLPRHRAAGPLRRKWQSDSLSGGEHPDHREWRGGGGSQIHHLEDPPRYPVVGRHSPAGRGCGLHRRILPASGCRLRAAEQLRRYRQDRCARRTHHPDPFLGRQAVPLRPVRRSPGTHPPESAVQGLPRSFGPLLHQAEFRPPSAPARSR